MTADEWILVEQCCFESLKRHLAIISAYTPWYTTRQHSDGSIGAKRHLLQGLMLRSCDGSLYVALRLVHSLECDAVDGPCTGTQSIVLPDGFRITMR